MSSDTWFNIFPKARVMAQRWSALSAWQTSRPSSAFTGLGKRPGTPLTAPLSKRQRMDENQEGPEYDGGGQELGSSSQLIRYGQPSSVVPVDRGTGHLEGRGTPAEKGVAHIVALVGMLALMPLSFRAPKWSGSLHSKGSWTTTPR